MVLPDGQRIAAAAFMEVQILAARDCRPLKTLLCHEMSIKALAVTPNGLLVTGGVDRTVRITNPESGEAVATLAGHGSFVFSLAVTPDSKEVVSGGDDAVVKVWSVEAAGQEEGPMFKGLRWDASVRSLALSPDGRYILSTHGSGLLLVQGAASGNVVGGSGVDTLANFVHVDRKRARILTAGKDGLIRAWDLKKFKAAVVRDLECKELEAFAYAEDADACVFACKDRVGVMEVATGHRRAEELIPDEEIFRAVGINRDASRAAAVEVRQIRFWDQAGGWRTLHAGSNEPLLSAAVDADCRLALVAPSTKEALVIDLLSGKVIRTLAGGEFVYGVAIDSSCGLSVTGSSRGLVQVWDVSDGHRVASFDAEAAISACAILPPRRILCGTLTGKVFLLELRSGDV